MALGWRSTPSFGRRYEAVISTQDDKRSFTPTGLFILYCRMEFAMPRWILEHDSCGKCLITCEPHSAVISQILLLHYEEWLQMLEWKLLRYQQSEFTRPVLACSRELGYIHTNWAKNACGIANALLPTSNLSTTGRWSEDKSLTVSMVYRKRKLRL